MNIGKQTAGQTHRLTDGDNTETKTDVQTYMKHKGTARHNSQTDRMTNSRTDSDTGIKTQSHHTQTDRQS